MRCDSPAQTDRTRGRGRGMAKVGHQLVACQALPSAALDHPATCYLDTDAGDRPL
jgi:hypothetical protein